MALDKPGYPLDIYQGLAIFQGQELRCNNLRPITHDGRQSLSSPEILDPILENEPSTLGRGGLVRFQDRIYTVDNAGFSRIDYDNSAADDLTVTQISNVGVTDSPASTAKGLNHIVVVSSASKSAYAINTVNDTVSRIDGENNFLPNTVGVVHINGFFVFWTDDNKIFHSDINNPFSYRALDATTIQQTDKIQSVVEFRGELVVFFPETLLRYSFIGGANFVFQARPNTRVKIGLVSSGLITSYGDDIYFVGSKRNQSPRVYRYSGTEPVQISNDYIDNELAQLGIIDPEPSQVEYCLAYGVKDIETLVIRTNGGSFTFCYDLQSGKWFDRSVTINGGGIRHWQIQAVTEYRGRLLASTSKGMAEIAYQGFAKNDEDGGERRFSFTIPSLDLQGKAIRFSGITLKFWDRFSGECTLSYSDDGGQTFNVLEPIRYNTLDNSRMEWNRLGSTDYTRILRFDFRSRFAFRISEVVANR